MFFLTIQKILQYENIVYPDENPVNFLSLLLGNIPQNAENAPVHIFFGYMIYDIFQGKSRTASFVERLQNIFILDGHKMEIFEKYCKIHKTYNALNRLVYLYKYKKSTIQITDDLRMETIDTKDRQKYLVIYQNNFRYLFTFTDIINICNTALMNSLEYSYFYPDPLPIKNPYNNMVFSKSILYNIYFQLKDTSFLMPTLFHKFFLAEFELEHFAEFNFELLSEYSIKNHLLNSTNEELKKEILIMMEEYDECEINIHPEFPADKLANIFKPYLFLYYIVLSTNKDILRKKVSRELLENKLDKFSLFNPYFGRKKYIIHKPYSRDGLNKSNNMFVFSNNTVLPSHTIVFNDIHLPYNKL
jgi:hypothetical protein